MNLSPIFGVPVKYIKIENSYKNYALDNRETAVGGFWNSALKMYMNEYYTIQYLIASVYDSYVERYKKKPSRIDLYEFNDGFSANSVHI